MFNKKEILKPKYQIGDEVWFIEYSSAISKKITGSFYKTKDTNEIVYSFDEKLSEYGWIKEELLFISKKSLIDSL